MEQHVGGGQVRLHDAAAEGEGGELADSPPDVVLTHPGLTVTAPEVDPPQRGPELVDEQRHGRVERVQLHARDMRPPHGLQLGH